MDEAVRALTVRIEGRVQGVYYRGWTEERAREFGLSGWVRNEPDGAVTALIGGTPDAVAKMLALFWEGPAAARVTSVTSRDADPAELPRGFGVTR